jgi:hypothetical protein
MLAIAASVSAYAVSRTLHGMDLRCFEEEVCARHLGHALIDQEQGHRPATLLQFARRLEGGRARSGFEHPVVAPVAIADVPLNRVQDFGVVVDNENDGLGHVRRGLRSRRTTPRPAAARAA